MNMKTTQRSGKGFVLNLIDAEINWHEKNKNTKNTLDWRSGFIAGLTHIKCLIEVNMEPECTVGHWVTLKKPYYSNKKDVVGREGVVVGESRDKTMWRIKWKGSTGSFNYPKENIEI